MKEKHTQWLDHQNNQVSRMFWLFIKLIKVECCEADLLSISPLLEQRANAWNISLTSTLQTLIYRQLYLQVDKMQYYNSYGKCFTCGYHFALSRGFRSPHPNWNFPLICDPVGFLFCFLLYYFSLWPLLFGNACFFLKIQNLALKIGQILDPEKPIGDPQQLSQTVSLNIKSLLTSWLFSRILLSLCVVSA